MCRLWRFVLEKGNAVGAFVVDEKNPKPLLVGANMTMVHTKDVEKEFEALKVFKIFKFQNFTGNRLNIFECFRAGP